MASEIPEIVYAFGPQLNAFMAVGILLKYFAVSCSSLSEDSAEFRFCPRVPVHKSRYKGPNNTQQLMTPEQRKNNGYSLVNPYTRTEPELRYVPLYIAGQVEFGCSFSQELHITPI